MTGIVDSGLTGGILGVFSGRPMRAVCFRFLILIVLFLGMGAKVYAQNPVGLADMCHSHCHAEAGGGCGDSTDHDSDCPASHHHHCACPHANPLWPGAGDLLLLLPPGGCYLGVSRTSDEIPDGPVLEKEIPPVV